MQISLERQVKVMVDPTRITVAFDKQIADPLYQISIDAYLSHSEIMQHALKFYGESKPFENPATNAVEQEAVDYRQKIINYKKLK